MTDEQVGQIVQSLRAANDTKAMAAVLRSFPKFLPDRAKLAANAVRCLCVIGEHDPNRPAAEATAKYMANLEMHVIEGTKHILTSARMRSLSLVSICPTSFSSIHREMKAVDVTASRISSLVRCENRRSD